MGGKGTDSLISPFSYDLSVTDTEDVEVERGDYVDDGPIGLGHVRRVAGVWAAEFPTVDERITREQDLTAGRVETDASGSMARAMDNPEAAKDVQKVSVSEQSREWEVLLDQVCVRLVGEDFGLGSLKQFRHTS